MTKTQSTKTKARRSMLAHLEAGKGPLDAIAATADDVVVAARAAGWTEAEIANAYRVTVKLLTDDMLAAAFKR